MPTRRLPRSLFKTEREILNIRVHELLCVCCRYLGTDSKLTGQFPVYNTLDSDQVSIDTILALLRRIIRPGQLQPVRIKMKSSTDAINYYLLKILYQRHRDQSAVKRCAHKMHAHLILYYGEHGNRLGQ